MAMEDGIDRLSDHVNLSECSTKLVRIDDHNYRSVIDWFKSCLKLSKDLDPSQRDEYELSLIGNVKTVLSEFFGRTELSLNTLIGLEREISSMFDMLSPPSNPKGKDQCGNGKQSASPEEPSNPSCSDLEDAMSELHRKLLWVAISSIILLLLLILVLFTLCWLRRCISSEMEESFANCPSKEDTKGTQESSDKRGSTRSQSLAYPIRVWMNPFSCRSASQVREPKMKCSKKPEETRKKAKDHNLKE